MSVVVFSVLAFLAIRLLDVQYGETVFVVIPFLGGLIAAMHTPTRPFRVGTGSSSSMRATS